MAGPPTFSPTRILRSCLFALLSLVHSSLTATTARPVWVTTRRFCSVPTATPRQLGPPQAPCASVSICSFTGLHAISAAAMFSVVAALCAAARMLILTIARCRQGRLHRSRPNAVHAYGQASSCCSLPFSPFPAADRSACSLLCACSVPYRHRQEQPGRGRLLMYNRPP